MAASLSFRSLRRADFPYLVQWLGQPHVAAWWREAGDAVAVAAKYGPLVDGAAPTHVFLIVVAAAPIGWIQWYRWADYPAYARLIGATASDAGLDVAIGEASMLGQGLGSRAIRQFMDEVIFADATMHAVVSDPEVANLRSQRAFAKAGFQPLGTVHVPGEAGEHRVLRCVRAELS